MLSKYVSSTENPLRSDLYILGVCYFNKGNYSNAVNALSRTVRQNDEQTQNAYLYLGQSYLKLGDKTMPAWHSRLLPPFHSTSR